MPWARRLDPVLAVPWNAGDAVKVFFFSWIGTPLFIQAVLIILALAVPEVRQYILNLKGDEVGFNLGLVVLDALAALAIVYHYVKVRHHLSLRAVGLRPFNPFAAVALIGIGFVLLAVAVGLSYWALVQFFPQFNPNQAQVNEFTTATTPVSRNLSFIALVLLPPPIEEIVFRGFMFPAFATRFGPLLGAVITSLLFGLAHFQLNVSVYTLILSLLLCLLYWRLKSIWPGIVLHMINNYLAFAMLYRQ